MSNKAKSLPSFKMPPVVEVVMGMQFDQPIGLRTLDVADIWESFDRKDFPNYEEARPLDPILPPNILRFEITNAPDLPRYLFRGKDGSCLIQFQRDRFIYNWTRPDGKSADCYPRYDTVFKSFIDYYKKLLKALRSKNLPMPVPTLMELSYINLIDNPHQGVEKISHIFKDISWKSENRFLPPPKRITFANEFQIDELKAMLHVNAMPVQLVKDGRNMLKLELSVKGPLQDQGDSAMGDWFGKAREWIVKGFSDLTTEQMHAEWERQND